MKMKVDFESLFVFSESERKYFFTEFSDVNIVYGKNTSGKSTLFQSIVFAFGINEDIHHLSGILNEKVVFRIDAKITSQGSPSQSLIIIRDDETIIVKVGDKPPFKFNGISGNNSFEHIKLKEFLSNLFGFSLQLESKGEIKPAPIETIFLPYYISQKVGWVYLRKSFSSLDFYKNFKEDYLDYYLGIESSYDRIKKHELNERLKSKTYQLEQLREFEESDSELQITKLQDEVFIVKAGEYLERYTTDLSSLKKDESEHMQRCNELSFFEQRLATVRRVSRNHKEQKPETGSCPICLQSLPISLEGVYKYSQEENDSQSEIVSFRDKIKKSQAKINSLKKSIMADREAIASKFEVFKQYNDSSPTMDSWIESKANVRLISRLELKQASLLEDITGIKDELGQYKTDEEVENKRHEKENQFTTMFSNYLGQLKVKPLEGRRYTKLYEISAFPSLGVELHKTIIAYHFAFNNLISGTDTVHRMPFLLDAVFKEDIEGDNKDLIMGFINNNRPRDTQIAFSVADTRSENKVNEYNSKFFQGRAKLICIGNGENERSFLSPYDQNLPTLLIEDTLSLIDVR